MGYQPVGKSINLISVRVYISGFLAGSNALTSSTWCLHVRPFDRVRNPQICGSLNHVIYRGVPPMCIGFGRYYGLFNFVLTGRLLVGSNAVASSTPCLYTRGCLAGLEDSL